VIELRAAVPADRAAIAAVVSSDATFKPDEIAIALELVDDAFAGDVDYRIRVAELGGAVVGYLCYGPTPMTAATYDLYWIVVSAQVRGQGVARALIEGMEDELRAGGGGHIRVETSETEGYGAARTLYARTGYPEVARMRDFYGPGDALIVYYKIL
jgi:GNAT superfamily N-acetyltransferase